LHFKMMPWNN